MAINIKELFSADADNIKVDKINYNFDQLLVNGGGPSGIKGDTGLTGNTGLKGEKGDTGSKGEVGTKGEQGSSANLWDRDTLSLTGGDVDIYRPYDNASGRRSRIVLGDSTNSVEPNTPPTDTDSLLNLSLPPATDNDVSSQIIFNNDETGDPKDFKMSTYYEVGVGTIFTFAGEAAAVSERTSLVIDIPDAVTITGGANVNVGNISNTNNVNIAAANLINLDADNDINMYAGSQIEVESQQIVIQGPGGSGGTIDISSSTNTITSTGNNEIISDGGDNLIEQLNGGGTNVIRANDSANIITAQVNTITSTTASSGSAGNIIETTSSIGVKNVLRNGTNDSFFTTSNLNTSRNTMLFDQDGVVLDGVDGNTGPERGEGIQFPEGGQQVENFVNIGVTEGLYAAPNLGSTEGERTLNDYFHKSDWTDWKISAIDTSSGSPHSRGFLDAEPTGTAVTSFGPSSISFKEGSYIKIGDVIHGYGTITAVATGTSWNFDLDSNLEGRSLFIDLTDYSTSSPVKDTFPFLNASASPVLCDMTFTINSNNSLLGEYPHIKGIIYPNSNRIYLYRMLYQADKIFLRALSPKDIGGNGGTTFRLSFKFSMIADNQQSYSRKYLYNDIFAGFSFSDRNLKTNIVKVGESPSGYNIYEFNFIDNLPEYVIEDLGGHPKDFVFQGVIADELPSELVMRFPNEDFDRVKYGEIDVEFKKVR